MLIQHTTRYLKPSAQCIELVKEFEGASLTVYQDLAGLNTVGYGHRTAMKVGTRITARKADQLLSLDLQIAADVVRRFVTVPLTQNQFDALVSFVFNVGGRAFARSTMLVHINRHEFTDAAAQFQRWCHVNGNRVEGLARRRHAEAILFGTPETA